MSHFCASIQGSRGEVTRCGTASSGMHVYVHGWNSGVKITARNIDGKDKFFIYKTSDSNDRYAQKLIGVVVDQKHGPVFIPEHRMEES